MPEPGAGSGGSRSGAGMGAGGVSDRDSGLERDDIVDIRSSALADILSRSARPGAENWGLGPEGENQTRSGSGRLGGEDRDARNISSFFQGSKISRRAPKQARVAFYMDEQAFSPQESSSTMGTGTNPLSGTPVLQNAAINPNDARSFLEHHDSALGYPDYAGGNIPANIRQAATSSDATSSGHAKQATSRINPYISNFPALVRQRPMGSPQVEVVPNSEEFFGNYFNRLQAEHPSFRVPSPHGGSYQEDDPISQAIADKFRDERLQGLISQSTGAPVIDAHGSHGNEGLKFGGAAAAAPTNPYARSSTYGSMSPFDFDEQITAQPGLFDAETSDSYNDWLSRISPEEAAWLGLSPAKPGDPYIDPRTLKTVGNIDLVRTGVSGGTNPATGLPYKPGETLKQSFLPEGVGGQYWGIASPTQSRTDLIKLAKSSGQSILDHENVHAGMRMVTANTPSWQGKIDFQGEDLFDVIFDKQRNEWDHVAMHIGIYATNNGTMPQNFWDHPVLKDINDDESLTLDQKERRMVARGKVLGLKLNDAAGLVLAGPVSQENPSNWFNISSTPWFTGAEM